MSKGTHYVQSARALAESSYCVETPEGDRHDTPQIKPLCPAQEVKWVWPGRIVLGKVTLIEGPAGSGKSFVALDLAARVSSGRTWPDGPPLVPPADPKSDEVDLTGPADVVLISQHDNHADTVARRFEQMGGNRKRLTTFHHFHTRVLGIEHYDDRLVQLPLDMTALFNLLFNKIEAKRPVRLVVIDPLSDFCHKPKELKEALYRLNDLACRFDCAIVVTLPAGCRVNAEGRLKVTSRWPTDGARSSWCIVQDPDDLSRRVLVPKRTSFCQEPDGLEFRIKDGAVVWEPQTKASYSDPLGKIRGCNECLAEILQAGDVPANEVYRQGAEQGYSRPNLRAARVRIGASTRRIEFGEQGHWSWSRGAAGETSSGSREKSGGENGEKRVEGGERREKDKAANPGAPAEVPRPLVRGRGTGATHGQQSPGAAKSAAPATTSNQMQSPVATEAPRPTAGTESPATVNRLSN